MLQMQRYAGPEPLLHAGGMPEGLDAYLCGQALKRNVREGNGATLLFIARDDSRAVAFKNACQYFHPDLKTLYVPAWDVLPYDRISPAKSLAAKRARGLFALTKWKVDRPLIIISTVAGVSQKVAPQDVMSRAGLVLKPGKMVEREALLSYLTYNGFSWTSAVMDAGDYAVRGGLIDLFPPGNTRPVRIDFFGDEIESLRRFDIETQRSTEKLERLILSPVSEVLMQDVQTTHFRKAYIETFGGGISQDPIYAQIKDGIRPQGVESFLPLFYPALETLFDYLPQNTLVVNDGQSLEAHLERHDLVLDYYDARKQHLDQVETGAGDPAKTSGVFRPVPIEQFYLAPNNMKTVLSGFRCRYNSPFNVETDEDYVDFGGRLGRNFLIERQTDGVNVFDAAASYVKDALKAKKRIILASWTEGSSERLGGVLADHDLIVGQIDRRQFKDLSSGQVKRTILPIEQGFTYDDLIVLSEQDILGDRLVNRARRRKAKNFISEASALKPNDLIIHIDHGLGRYLGLKTLDVTGAPHDCLELEYSGGSRLYLPVENIELLSAYGTSGDNPVLDTLGGVAWQSRKAKAKKKLQDMAAELIIIAAKRAMRTAEPVKIDQGEFGEFCARFPYAETDDQLAAIDDVIGDLERGRPMDRLICGDVGFGKTEVALRGAFAAAMNGQQVAIIAPTTLLCRQHFNTFTARFKGWPVNIRQLSRLVTTKQRNETIRALKDGQCDIVIGTHALLADSVGFSNLGMVIVDEEQRFGVKHKERLKSLRADVHVLTLTATPIPRTLQMALTGIRDLSLIATPPVDRLAIRTYVSGFDTVTLRKALLREKYRGGQSYFIAPRIADLSRLEAFLTEQVPEVKYITAHGQMAPTELEDIMTAFYEGQYDVLLATSIIESGIDIPRANTMIVYRADRFGLAQLYQMRGRVGRSKIRAYAYMTMPEANIATANARDRLKVLQSLDSLGAGFTLASHDLDMRGGGNPLGEEQSGHIKDLGVELYQHLLEEAVAQLKNDDSLQDQSWSPQVNLGIPILIPETYIEDLNLRLAIYRRISEISDDNEGDALAAELIDRFGPLPNEVDSLFKVMKIKRLCRLSHVEKVDAGAKGLVLTIRHKDVTDGSMIMLAITNNSGWRLRPDKTILVKGNFEKAEQRLKAVERAVKALSE
ncbi:MAG: transcription-repair coupling factor [Maricaulaceae bacterium]